MYSDYNFKEVLCDVSSEGEWLYMIDDEEGTVVNSYDLVIADKADVDAAIYFGWDKEEIVSVTGFLLTPELEAYINSKFDD